MDGTDYKKEQKDRRKMEEYDVIIEHHQSIGVVSSVKGKDTCLKALVSNQGNQDVATSASGALMLQGMEPRRRAEVLPRVPAASRCWGHTEAHSPRQ